MVSVSARRSGVAYARERGLSARRACTLLRVARSALGYRSRKAATDAPVIERMMELARRYPRYEAYPDFSGPGRTPDERRSGVPAMADGAPAGTTQPAAEANCELATKAVGAEGCQRGVELRFRLRRVC